MAGFDWDESQWPVVRVTIRPDITMEQYEELFARYRQTLERRTPYVMVQDSREAPPMSAVGRQRVAQVMGELEPLSKRYVRGVAVVLSTDRRAVSFVK